jgi:hypothetical protein
MLIPSQNSIIQQFFFPITWKASLTTNWVVPNGGSASNKWSFTTLAAFSGSQSMTESPSGDYPVGTTRTVTYKNTLNLTGATGAYLTFWVKHRAENHRDRLQVQFSTNGSTWTPIVGTTPIQEPGTIDGAAMNGEPGLTGIQDFWLKETYNLSAYLGQAAVEFRFVFFSR